MRTAPPARWLHALVGWPGFTLSTVAADDPEKVPVEPGAEKLLKNSRLGADITEEGTARVQVLRVRGGVTRHVPAAILVLERSLRGSEKRLLRKDDRDLRFHLIRRAAGDRVEMDPAPLPPKKDLEVPARPQLLAATLRLPDENHAVLELPRLDKNPVPEDEPLQIGHQRLCRLLEHLRYSELQAAIGRGLKPPNGAADQPRG